MWLELHLQIPSAEAEAVEAQLEASGALSVTLLDAYDDPVLEPAPGTRPLWPHVIAVGLYESATDPLDLLIALEGRISAAALASARFARVDDRDWTRAWMDHYHPMRFGRRLWIYPWTEATPQDEQAVVVRLDPGLAFGTGTHPTTALCLEWLDGMDLNGLSVTDFGCGSGILAIAALKLGAAHAFAIDNDPQALIATRENAERNGVADRLTVLSDRDPLPPASDVLLANILLNPLIRLHEQLTAAVRNGGHAVFSGMLAEQSSEFINTYQRRFARLQVDQREDWIRIAGQRSS
jgi:ribosomal protein L11 methyltransferase